MLPRPIQSVLATLVALLALPILLWRRKTRRGLAQRLGHLPPPPARDGPRLWIHAASAGDVKNAWPVVRALKEARPSLTVLLTYVTNSAEQMVGTLSPPPDVHAYAPLDAPLFVRRALDAWRPAVLLLEMTELWPALVAQARARGVSVALCNGRMSPRSAARYAMLFGWLTNPVPALAVLCLQTDADRTRYLALGASPERAFVTGNCKFDAAARTPSPEKVAALRGVVGERGPLLCAGSTHAGEEDVVVGALAAARGVVPGCRLLWAPRYLEHVDGLMALCLSRGWRVARRSAGAVTCAAADVVILDTMGELAAAYALAQVALVGGSWVPRGGQNILEPAAQGVPVLHGPHMFLAPDQVEVLDGHGARLVNRGELPAAVVHWFTHDNDARREGEAGRAAVSAVAGAAARHTEHLLPLLPS
ncbi:MAG: 3-deoxy-D-manno-octulosonic acid transferase [Deltaproteobacteria bacterium]|nr:3-deoxy-D-manno-octulosonic acid transferase [Deltaproteobacteria bacterium]